LTDFLKSTVLGVLLIAVLVAGAFGLVSFSPSWWWLWVWVFFAAVSLFLLYVSPYIIEPLFYRFEPVSKEGLEDDIRCLMGKAGLEVSRVLQVDASRRSQHSNAYFTGIGRVKRIVLYDTLLDLLENREILAVLAHETGHWKKQHLLKRLVLAEAQALAACFTAFLLLKSGWLPPILGAETASFAAQLLFTGFIFSLAATLFTPLGSWLSRRHEQQADNYAVKLSGMPDALASALIKMGRDNLANLHSHWLYAVVYYSHPPLAERVSTLLSLKGTNRHV
jgi:STE24 endopeptidase